MKVLYLHQHFRTPDQAGGTRSFEFARRWVRWGHEVVLVTSRQDPGEPFHGWRIREVAGISIHEIHVPYRNTMGFSARIRAFLRFAARSGLHAAKCGGDVVFATSTPLTIALPGVFASQRLRVPLVFEVRDLWPEIPIALGVLRNPVVVRAARALESWAYRNSSSVVALSPGMAKGIADRGYPVERLTIVPNSSDVELFEQGDPSRFFDQHPQWKGRKIVLYAGTFGDINGVGYLVELAVRLRHRMPEALVLLIGEGKQQESIRARARQLGVLDVNLVMMPPLPKRRVVDCFAASSIATSVVIDLPPLWHNSANKFFDSLAASRAVGINHEGWQADLIRKFSLGVVLPPRDFEAAAAILAEFLGDDSRVEAAGVAAGRLARTRFDRDRLALTTLDVLLAAAGKTRVKAAESSATDRDR
jgi:glycosyltransferase involved in cell wall biosynthesis